MACLRRFFSALRRGRAWAAMVLTAAAHAQLPSPSELTVALAASAAVARQSGLAWRPHGLWMQALRTRSPLVVAHHQGVCHLGFSAYTPGRDYRWLFPSLAPAQRALWLAGVVHHELAHCAEQAALATEATDAVPADAHQQEVLADLAFALHVDHAAADGAALVALLADLRAGQAAADPLHDTADALRCYLRQRDSDPPAGDWLARLRAWRVRCSTPKADASAAAAVAAWGAQGAVQSRAPQPVATRR